ncbi:Zinc finger BED domain-containing protein 5, partial [Stegodyphus mimosarum]
MDPQPQCVVCGELLHNQNIKDHHESKHANLMDKSEEYFKRKLSEFSNSKQAMKGFVTSNEKALETSYPVSLGIATTGQAHSVGENLILPIAKDIVLTLFNENMANQLNNILLSKWQIP